MLMLMRGRVRMPNAVVSVVETVEMLLTNVPEVPRFIFGACDLF